MDKNLYEKTVVNVQKRSGFDKSHQNLFTANVGTIIPIMCDELIPNTTVDLKAAISAQLPPLASDTFMRCKLKYASFFVPTRLLVSGYERWLTGSDKADSTIDSDKRVQMPLLDVDFTNGNVAADKHLEPGSLADYLGAKFKRTTLTQFRTDKNTKVTLSALPFLAYHRIYDDWFRNSLVQKPVFVDSTYATASDYSTYIFKNSKFVCPTTASHSVNSQSNDAILGDGVRITDLRQANFDIDMFSAAYPQAQQGAPVQLNIVTGSTGDYFSIASLRSANSLQQFLERNAICGSRMVDFVRGQYGAKLSDGVAQRAILLGSGDFDVYSKGIYQTANSDVTSISTNPFAQTSAAKFGSAYADGKDNLCKFTCQEPGYLMVVAWLSPHVTYATGVSPYLHRYVKVDSQSDMANPILQNVGNEALMVSQIQDSYNASGKTNIAFGYSDRYCTWKDKVDECHGQLRDGETLQSFALQRSFTSPSVPTKINSAFLEIPTNYLDQVFAVDASTSNVSYWCDTYFDYKVSMPLARYSVPSLQDPAAEHGETVVVERGGKRLS